MAINLWLLKSYHLLTWVGFSMALRPYWGPVGKTESINKCGEMWNISDWIITNFPFLFLGSKFFGSFLARYAESHVGGVRLWRGGGSYWPMWCHLIQSNKWSPHPRHSSAFTSKVWIHSNFDSVSMEINRQLFRAAITLNRLKYHHDERSNGFKVFRISPI